MQRLFCGSLGRPLAEFENATLRDIDNCVKGWQEGREAVQRNYMVVARWQALWLMSPHVKKGSMSKIEKAMRFPWEKVHIEFKGDVKAVLEKWEKIPVKK